MVLYNSPYAVALLVAGLGLVAISVLIGRARLLRALPVYQQAEAAASRPTPSSILALRRHTRLTILGVLGVLLFWLLLGVASIHDAFGSHPAMIRRIVHIEWKSEVPPPLRTTFDRFELPGSASRREQPDR